MKITHTNKLHSNYKYQILSKKGEHLASYNNKQMALQGWTYWSTTHSFQHPYKVGF